MSPEVIPPQIIEAFRAFIVDRKCGNIVVHFDRGRIHKFNMDEAVKID